MLQKRKLQNVSNSNSGNKKARLAFDDTISIDPEATADQQELVTKSETKKKGSSNANDQVAARNSNKSKRKVIKQKKNQFTIPHAGENKTSQSKKPQKAASSEGKKQLTKSKKLSSKGKQHKNLSEPHGLSSEKSNKNVKKQLTANEQSKKRKRLSSDEEMSYESHFSSDSDDSSEQPAHSDRTTQRDRRRARAERLQRTLFVGNLPPQVTRKRLKQLFNKYLRSDPKCLKWDCHVESVRFRGVVPSTGGLGKLARKRAVVQGELSAGVSQNLLAYVVLSSKLGIPTALSLNGHWLQSDHPVAQSTTEDTEEDKGPTSSGRFIRVDAASAHRSTINPQYCVFLGNLAFDVQEDEVRDALSRFGEITNVRLIRDRETGAVKGIGYVQFEDPAAVSLAIRASQSISVRDRPIRIEECKPIGVDATSASAKDKRANWKSKATTVKKIKTTKLHGKSMATSAKLHYKLDQTGRAKGITLPSNLRGSMRERYLEKRLAKKRKRQLRRQRHEEQQVHEAALAEEMKAKQKALRLKRRKARKAKGGKKSTKKTKPKQKA